jgi:hypothetical protein
MARMLAKERWQKGPAGHCVAEENVTVKINGQTLTFTNSELKNYILPFSPKPDGSFGEIHSEGGTEFVVIKAKIVGDTLDADVNNPPCEHHWHLKKQ